MAYATTVDELLSVWEKQGKKPSPEELCAGHPELLGELRSAIDKLNRVDQIIGPTGDSSKPLPGNVTIPNYEIIRRIGEGGQGEVYLARRLSINRCFAIKVLRSATPQQLERFRREAHILASLKHPGIVPAFDLGVTDQGGHYLVMEYVDGRPLDDYAKALKMHETPTGLREGLEVFVGVCDAVGAAHIRGIIHRDLKPSNIRVDAQGRPYALDFGLARSAFEEHHTRHGADLTANGQFLGTLPWASPEQANGFWDDIDTRADVYSLGVILYQLLAGGRFPYDVRGSQLETLQNICSREPAPLRIHRRSRTEKGRRSRSAGQELSQIDAKLEAIVMVALAKPKPKRYRSANEMAADLRTYLRGETPTACRKLTATTRRKRAPWAVAVVSGIALAGAGAGFYYSRPSGSGPATHSVATMPTPPTPLAPDPRPEVRERLEPQLTKALRRAEALAALDARAAQTLAPSLQAVRQRVDTALKPPYQQGWEKATTKPIQEDVRAAEAGVEEAATSIEAAVSGAIETWLSVQRKRPSGVLLPSGEARGQIDRAWVTKRDGVLAKLPEKPSLDEAIAAHKELDRVAKLTQEVARRLGDPPTYQGPANAGVAQRVQVAWQSVVMRVAERLASGDQGAVKLAEEGIAEARQRAAEFTRAGQLCQSLPELVLASREPAGLGPRWSQLRDDLQAAEDLTKRLQLGGLIGDLAGPRELLRAHEAPNLAVLTPLSRSHRVETVLECSRRAESLTDGPATATEMAAALAVHKRWSDILQVAATLSGRGAENPLSLSTPWGPLKVSTGTRPLSPEQRQAVDRHRQDLKDRLVRMLVIWGHDRRPATMPAMGSAEEAREPAAVLAELAAQNREWLPLEAPELAWLAFNIKLHEARGRPLPKEDAGLASIAEELCGLAGQVREAWKDSLTDALHPASVGPGKDKWQVSWIKEGERLRLTLPSGSPSAPSALQPLEFVLVRNAEGQEGADFFLLTTELTIQDVIQITSAAQQWGQLASLLPSPKAGRPWLWTWAPSGQIVPTASGIPPLTTPMPADPEPLRTYPMTHVTPAAAIQVGHSLGCRLPTTAEWRAALRQAQQELHADKDMRPRLRNVAWTSQLPCSAKTGIWLDEGIFKPRAFPLREARETVWSEEEMNKRFGVLMKGIADQDGSVLYRQVNYQPNGRLKDIVGNVAELVLDRPLQSEVAPGAAGLPAWVKQHVQDIGVIGGSALSPKDLDPATTYPITDAAAGYSDVGFRLAFDSQAVSLRRRLELLIKRLRYANAEDQQPRAGSPSKQETSRF